MNKLLKDPKKRRRLIIAAGAAGVLVLLLLLTKKKSTSEEATSETGASPAVEQIPVPAETPGASSGAGSTGQGQELLSGIAALGAQQAAASNAAAQAAAQGNQETQADIAGLADALAQGQQGQTREGGAEQKPSPLAATAKPALLTNEQKSNPRYHQLFESTVNAKTGDTEHVYQHAVPGGVGPKKNRIVIPKQRTPSVAPSAHAQARNPRAGLPFTTTTYKGKRAHEYKQKVKGGVGPGGRYVIL